MTMTLRSLLVAAALACALAAAPAANADIDTMAPSSKQAYTAKVLAPTVARSQPGGGQVVARLGAQAPLYGGSNVLLVLDAKTVDGVQYLQVRLPKRPNSSSGWVSADSMYVSATPYRVVVDLSARKVTIFKAGRKLTSTRAVVGAGRTPTPTGLFAVTEKVPQPRGSELGRHVVALAAHSDVHKTFAGGDGTIGMHGYERLGDRLGSAASNGCIRVPARFLSRLVRLVPPGAPVLVQP